MEPKEIFSHEIKVGLKTVNVRKWKAKDRKAFKKLAQTEDDLSNIIKQTLVYSCIEDKSVALTENEIQYLFVQLRKISIGDDFTFDYTCDCEFNNSLKVKIDDVCKPVFKEYSPISVGNIIIELQDIKNKTFYEENKDEYDDIKEMAFRVKSINGDNTKSFDEVVSYLEELEVNDFDSLYEQFQEINFNVNNIHSVKCSKCNLSTEFEFDEINNFFPDSWTK